MAKSRRKVSKVAAKVALSKKEKQHCRTIAEEILQSQLMLKGNENPPSRSQAKAAVERRLRQEYGLGLWDKIKLFLVISWAIDIIDEIFTENGWK